MFNLKLKNEKQFIIYPINNNLPAHIRISVIHKHIYMFKFNYYVNLQ